MTPGNTKPPEASGLHARTFTSYSTHDDKGDAVDVILISLDRASDAAAPAVGVVACVYNEKLRELTARVSPDLPHAVRLLESWIGEVPL